MRKVLFLTLLMALAVTAGAQSKWHFNFGVGGELKAGNVNKATFNNNGGVERNDSLISLDANYAIVYGEQDHVEYDKSLTANLKLDLWQYDRWSPFISATYFNNKFKGFAYQNSFLAGVKYRIFWNAMCDYSISAAYTFDYTDYFDKSNPDLLDKVSRISLRFKAKQKINDVVSLKYTFFYKPSVMDGFASIKNDYVMNHEFTLSTKLGKHLTFDFKVTYDYHSIVPESVKREDIITTGTLKLNF